MKKVLIVDDDEDAAQILSDMLEYQKIHVLGIAFNGKMALEKWTEFHPDIVLLDIMMPDYDGFYFLKNIALSDIKSKVIVISGDTTESTHKKLMKMNVVKIILKPVNIDDIISLIDQ